MTELRNLPVRPSRAVDTSIVAPPAVSKSDRSMACSRAMGGRRRWRRLATHSRVADAFPLRWTLEHHYRRNRRMSDGWRRATTLSSRKALSQTTL